MKVVESGDAELVAQCRAGNVEALETLYREHAPRLYALACRMSGSPDEAEDLLQDIFLKAYRTLGSFRGDAALGTWLYRLALNRCLDTLRGRQARIGRLTETLDEEAGPEPEAPPDTLITRLDLERGIARLPAGCRAIFVLHDVEGFDHKEVATMLGIAEGTSKSQVFRARMRLRALLGGRG